ncbi:MAG: oxalurate catabolism protein HpxZ [Usitatibacter sp.]
MDFEINLPEIVAEVEAVFARYEDALVNNRIEVLDELFQDSPTTVRYGIAENLVGIEAIRAYRSGRPPTSLARRLERTVITTYGRDMATAMTEFHREGNPRVGRQSQTWVRFPQGWRVVAAHVSLIDIPATAPTPSRPDSPSA